MLNKHLKNSYIEILSNKKKISLPLHYHYLTSNGQKISENKFEEKYVVYPSKFHQTEQHILTLHYKPIF
jgi:hypothetical protein